MPPKPFAALVVALLIFEPGFSQPEYDGLVEPVRDVWMGLQVSGRVAELSADEGDEVEEGRRLLALDDRIEQLEVERRQVVFEDESELQAARARGELLKQEVASTRELFKSTASVSREELERKEVEFRLSQIEIGRLEQDRRRTAAELAIARERLALNYIDAPFAGVVAEVRVDEGESVQSGQPVLRLVDVSRAFLVLNLPAEALHGVRAGQPAALRFRGEVPVVKTGVVAFVSPVVDPASGLRRVKMLFENDEPAIEPGRVGFWVAEGAGDE